MLGTIANLLLRMISDVFPEHLVFVADRHVFKLGADPLPRKMLWQIFKGNTYILLKQSANLNPHYPD